MPTKNYELMTVSDLGKVVRQQNYIVKGGILPERGRLVIGGQYKSGKSWMAMQAAYELANGMPFLGSYEVTRPVKVVYLDAENGPWVMHERFERMEPNYGSLGKDNLRIVTGRTPLLDRSKDVMNIETALKEYETEVLIIDPLYRFHEGDENSAQDMRRFLNKVDDLADKVGLAVILVHHTNKTSKESNGGGRKNTGDKLRGSTVIPGWATSILMIDGSPDKGEITIEPILRSARPEPFKLEFDEELGIFRPKNSAQDEAVMEHLRKAGGSMSMPELKKWASELLSKNEKTAERYIQNMVVRGKLVIEKQNGRTNLVKLYEQPVELAKAA